MYKEQINFTNLDLLVCVVVDFRQEIFLEKYLDERQKNVFSQVSVRRAK